MTAVPERWLVLTVEAPPGFRRALVVEELMSLGGRGVEEGPGTLTTYLPEPPDPEGLVARVRPVLEEAAGRSGLRIRWRWQEHRDWEHLWRQGLEARRITDRLIVAPTWAPVEPGPGEVVVSLDPGMAFGTAEHPTTRAGLRLLDARVRPGDRLADVGAGSAILAIAAVRLGAASVDAFEGDPWACEAARENAERNGVADAVRIHEGFVTAEGLASLGPYDGVLANIEWGLLKPLLQGVAAMARAGGWVVLGGILDEQRDQAVAGARAVGLSPVEEDLEGEWWTGAFLREPPAGSP